jgi:serine/threonine-protein kinase
MASVYKAYDPEADRLVALKVLSSDLAGDPRFSRRFRREAELVSQLSHPNIVPVWDYGEAEGHAYLVMPFIKVGNLADHLRRGRLSLEECTRLFDQVSSALDFAHRRGVVHRDIKPSNILLDEKGNALLTDFGLAQIQDASLSLTGSAMLGTPSYISPEQARGDEVDGRADQYSLAIILFELATGSLPFDAETPMAVILKHIQEPVPRPREINPRVPESIEQVILKATAKDPKYRFETVGEFNKAFKAALAHSVDPFANPAPRIELPPPDVTLPLGPALGSRGWSHRRRLASLAALLLLLLVCAVASPGLAHLLPGGRTGTPVAVLSGSSDPQLTALAATIQSLSTRMAATDGSRLSPEEMQTAVFLTLTAIGGTPPADGGGDQIPPPTATSRLILPPASNPTSVPPTRQAPPTATSIQVIAQSGPEPTEPSPVSEATATQPSPTETSSSPPVPSPTSALTEAPTSTPTSAWTSTSAPTPTRTSAPAPSATPNVCASTGLAGAGVQGREARWMVSNQSSVAITITALHLDWPWANDDLDRVELRDTTIWDWGDRMPPTDITGGWRPGAGRSVAPGESAQLDFRFSRDAAGGGYSLSLTLNGVCTVSGGQ